MKLRKLSMIMAVIMIITCLPVSGIAVNSTRDVEFQEMLGTLKALDIIVDTPEDPFDPDAPVNRADMVVMATKLLGVNTVGVSEKLDAFYDVPPEHEAYNEIIMAYNLGIISGVDHECFDPQGIVSYEQAVKIMVSVLGYDTVAQQLGGYPSGYLAAGMRTELLDNMDANSKISLTGRGVVRLLFNALQVDLFDASYYLSGGDYVEEVHEGRTLLEERFDVNTVRGVVTQNSITGLSSATPVSEGQVTINGTVYFVGDTNISAYLGYEVKAYYKEDGTKKDIIFFSEIEDYNKVLTLTDKDEVTLSYSGGIFTVGYEKNNRTLTETVNNTSCIYNGVYVAPGSIEGETGMLKALEGKALSVKLIDNNRDNVYDVIIIGAYDSVLVNTVSALNGIITYYVYKADGSFEVKKLDISEDADVEYTIYDADGNVIALDTIAPKNVVSIYESMSVSKKVYEIRVSTKKIKATIVTMDDNGVYGLKVVDESAHTDEEDGSVEITFDADYKKSPTFPEQLLRLGLKTTFYLDVDGNMTAYDMGGAVNGNYGMIMGCGKKPGLSGTYEFKIFTNEGRVVYLDSEKKITAYNPHSGKVEKTEVDSLIGTTRTLDQNGNDTDPKHKYYLWFTDNASYFTANAESGSANVNKRFYNRIWLSDDDKSNIASRQMVYYKTNEEGKITTIIVPDIPDMKHNKLTLLNNNGRYSLYNWVSGMRIFYDQKVGTDVTGGVDYIKVAEDVRVFSCIAHDYSEENFVVSGIRQIRVGTNKMHFYAIEGSTEAKLIMQYTPLTRETASGMPYVVVKSVSDNGDGTYALRGYSKGVEYSGTIAAGTRLIEAQLSKSSTGFDPIKQNEIRKYVTTSAGDGFDGEIFYDYATYPGSNHLYADSDSIKRGDVILVGKDRRDEICYVEIAMRAQNSVLVFPNQRSSYYHRITGDNCRKGVITGFTPWGEALVSCVGYYSLRTTSQVNYSGNFYYDKDMLHNFAACKNIWIYDYNVKVPEAATHYDLMEGDAILIDGTPHAPTECIILRNYPNEPDYSYWGGEVVEIPEVEPYGGDVSINFYDFEFVQPEFPEENQRKFVPVKPDKKTLQGMGYILTTPEVNASGGANPVYLVKRPGSSEENDWCVMMPNIGNTDLRRKREENPRAFSIQLDVARSAEATTKLVTEFEYSATAVAQGNIALNNSEGTPFLTIDMGETKATVNGSELYDYITAGGNDGFVKVQIVIDRTAKTADIYIDGEQKITGAALSADFTDLHSITFTQSAEDKTKQMGDVYVDNVKIYEADSVDTSAPVDPAPAKVYKVNENFNRFAASGSTQALNGADSGSVPINAWWHVDGAGYRSCEFIADTEDASNKFMALNPERLEGQKSIGNIWLRFPSIPFLIGEDATNNNVAVFEWDMKYTGSLGADFLTITMFNQTPDGAKGKDKILNAVTLGYDAGNDANENINQKWHKVVIIVDKSDASYEIYKVYTDAEGKQHAILAKSGRGTIPATNKRIDLINFLRTEKPGNTEQAYIDNIKIYEAPKSLVMGEFDFVE